MDKKVVRLFWSYDIKKTEEWLRDMGLRGYKLESVDFGLRIFKLIKAKKSKVFYRIIYDNNQSNYISKSLDNSGWRIISQHKGWKILINESEDINIMPSRNSVIERNNKLINYSGTALGFFILFPLILGFFTKSILRLKQVQVNYSETLNILGILYLLAQLSICIFLAYTHFKVKSSTKRIEYAEGIEFACNYDAYKDIDDEIYIGKKKSVVKRKIAWVTYPDKLELWLEKMEKRGFNLYKISKTGGKFYFLKGSTVNKKFSVDFKRQVTKEYFEINKEVGWKLYFSSNSRTEKWNIWAMDYDENGEAPKMYSDIADKISHAKKVATYYCILYVPMIIIYAIVSSFWIYIMVTKKRSLEEIFIIDMVLFGVALIEYSIFTINSILYYLRVKKGCKEGLYE
ncbi:hypothetical protein CSC2_25920 [Clostridium zeae]|uniref:DUF2812 domain-containing protein n=1 Tax=Clostridium zeae TaxID=2759022 RepID=A0ABQ1EBF0_9CLOT|nr:DUF2812 domain-containing protein [Clostridium zeae]GFZ32066.1 hypothetical protein CSC2_25920 [Clostridium zeae]